MTEKKLEAAERERIRTYAECAMSHLERISDVVLEKLGHEQVDGRRTRVVGVRIRRGAAQTDEPGGHQADGVPDVLVFEDEDGNCLGMYIDPPGICTDDC